MDFAHPEFTGRLIAGKDWYTNDNDPSDTPDEGHGTHTTGTTAGTTVGVAGVSGAAPHVKVYVQRVCGANGCPTSAIINAINAAADYIDAGGKQLVAVNLSLGGTTESTGEKTAIRTRRTQGVLIVASAGNSGSGKVACPACDPNAISVASTTWRDELAPYSQYGSGLDISAPGGNCYSNTTPEGCIFSSVVAGYHGRGVQRPARQQHVHVHAGHVDGRTTGDGYRGDGRLEDRPARQRVAHALLSTADDKGTPGYDTKFGNGRVNAYRAVTGSSLPAGQ